MTQHPAPGLDLTRLRALTKPHADERAILRRIETHLQAWDGFVAFSGGKDSLCVLHLSLQVEPEIPVVFFDSQLEFPETTEYLDTIANHLRISAGIRRYPARPGLLQLLMNDGSWDHTRPAGNGPADLRSILIDQPAAGAHRDCGPGELWGLRSAESAGRRHLHRTALTRETALRCHDCCRSDAERRARHGGVVTRVDGTVAYSPVWDWTTEQVWQYAARHCLPVNPIYRKLSALGAPPDAHRVTSVIDAHQLAYGRGVWLRRGWPELWATLLPALPRLRETT